MGTISAKKGKVQGPKRIDVHRNGPWVGIQEAAFIFHLLPPLRAFYPLTEAAGVLRGQPHMAVEGKEEEMVTPGDVLGKAADLRPGKGAYELNGLVYASLTGLPRTVSRSAESSDQRPAVEVIGLKARGAVPEPGSIVIARVTKVMSRMASVDIMCVGPKSVREKFTGTIRQQDVRATEIDKVDMHSSFRPGDTVRALVLSLGDARAYYLSTAKNELGVVSAESAAGATMIPISWTEMQCPLTGQVEQRKVAKVGS